MQAVLRGLLALSFVLLITGCARQSQQQAVDTALDSAANSQSSSIISENTANPPPNMPADVQLPNARVDLSTEVQDGYQVQYSSGLTPNQIKEFYRTREGWSVVAEFPTGDAESISIERPDQRVLVTITPEGNGSKALVTGAELKELDANQ